MPDFEGFPFEKQAAELEFEVAVHELLRSDPNILVSRLLYHRASVQHVGPSLEPPQDIAGRCLYLFERSEGTNNVFQDLSPEQRVRASFLLHSI